MNKTRIQPIGEIMISLMKKNSIFTKKLTETKLINYWIECCPIAVIQHTKEIFIKKRILYVQLNSSVLKNELTMQKKKIVCFLNKKVGKEIIDQIVFN